MASEIDVPIGAVPDSLEEFERFEASQGFHAGDAVTGIDPESARLRVDEPEHSKPVGPDATAVTIERYLDAGPVDEDAQPERFVGTEAKRYSCGLSGVSRRIRRRPVR